MLGSLKVLATSAILGALVACSGPGPQGADAAKSSVTAAQSTRSATTVLVADGPAYGSIEEALTAKYLGAMKTTRLVIGRITQDLGTIAVGTGEQLFHQAFYRLEITDPLRSGLSQEVILAGPKPMEGVRIETSPPAPEVGMHGVFVIASPDRPGDTDGPYFEKYGMVFTPIFYLEDQGDGTFADPENPKVATVSLDQVRAIPERGK